MTARPTPLRLAETPSIELLKSMDRDHAINTLRSTFNDLTTTPLERWLLDQLDGEAYVRLDPDALIIAAEDAEIIAAEDAEITVADLRTFGVALKHISAEAAVALLNVLKEHAIEDPETLEGALSLAKSFKTFANEFGEALIELITTAQE